MTQGLNEPVALIAKPAIMDTGATKLGSNANGIQRFASSIGMSRIVGEWSSRADVDPPPRFADAQSGFVLLDPLRLHQSRFEAAFHLGQRLLTAADKAGDAAGPELDSQPLAQQLAGMSLGHALTFYQIGRHRLDSCPILRRSRDSCRERRPSQVGRERTLLFFHPMLPDPQPLGRQIDHLPSGRRCLRVGCSDRAGSTSIR